MKIKLIVALALLCSTALAGPRQGKVVLMGEVDRGPSHPAFSFYMRSLETPGKCIQSARYANQSPHRPDNITFYCREDRSTP